MTTVKFLRDFRGRLTNESYYLAGEVADFEPAAAAGMVAEGAAVFAPGLPPVAEVPDPAPSALVIIDRADGIQSGEASEAGSVLAEYAGQPRSAAGSKSTKKQAKKAKLGGA